MPLYAILHSDIEGLHEKSCTLVHAGSPVEIAQHMLAHPKQWQALLYQLYPDDGDSRSLWQRIQADKLTPETLLALINQTCCDEPAEMVRIQPVQVQSLNQVKVETRWIGSDASDYLDSMSGDPPVSSAQTLSSSTIEELLAIYTQLRRRKGRELSAQLNQMRQQVIAEFDSIRQRELEFTALQETLLDQLQTHFAFDARSLLTTIDFERFVHSMLVAGLEKSGVTPPLQVAQSPADWVLKTLPHPLQLQNIQIIRPSKEPEITEFFVEMQVSLGDWSQFLSVPVGGSKDGLSVSYQPLYTTQQWIEVSYQIQKNLVKLPIAPDLQLGLAQELVCLLTYIGELFNITGIVDRLGSLQI
ncbi:hypothetical protein H6G89_28230 [Oscillatoria sp. FACHB-1407]|uniref:hypothetical protein n=1 Tax=Oscillatoria sp. FACHB-1407 TaxID=2692847 RepID=UPI0016874911|nr:hypothetical protein [Oscillatoria sp. FACHB-1407]MBD2464896.1 hypothetical protein [Oscillatoria sp. FACHB-1407]